MRLSITAAAAASSLFIVTSGALAADPVIYEAPPVAVGPVVYDWSGPYIGIHGGITAGNFDYEAGIFEYDIVNSSDNGGGLLGGAQIGYDWQVGQWVVGAVADFAFATHKTKSQTGIAEIVSASAESKLDYLGTVRARLGYAFDRALLYGHGGFAYAKTSQKLSGEVLGIGGDLYENSEHRNGWTIGAGLEYALTDRVSFGTEYSYVHLGNSRIYDLVSIAYVDEDVSFHSVKASINYRF